MYNIKIKTKEGTYEYEKEDLENIDLLLEQYRNQEDLEVNATREVEKCKKKVLKKPKR